MNVNASKQKTSKKKKTNTNANFKVYIPDHFDGVLIEVTDPKKARRMLRDVVREGLR